MKKFFGWVKNAGYYFYVALRWYYVSIVEWYWRKGKHVKLFLLPVVIPITVIPIIIIMFPFLYLFHPDLGTFSEGVRVGMIHEWGPDGISINPVTTYEGQMYLGYQSREWNDPITGKQDNPWHFSSSRSVLQKYQGLSGQYVYVTYRQVWWQLNHFWGDTDYRAVEVHPIDPNLAPEQCGSINSARGLLDSRSAPLTGRLVKDSEKGNFFFTKTWEVQIQKGDGGGAPADLSITDPKVKACADLFAKSGVLAQFIYERTAFGFRDPMQQDTALTIIGIKRLRSMSPQ